MQAQSQIKAMNFDAAYYDRFYKNPDTRATSEAEQATLANFLGAYLRYLDVQITSALDLGCGLGHLLKHIKNALRIEQVTGVEFSEYLCDRYGWQYGSVVDFSGTPHDLVICSDVLGYLNDKQCAKAIKNLAKLTQQALYISVLTEEDLALCDQQHTDMSQTARPASWYRKRLSKHFVNVGGGLYLKKPLNVAVWALERGE